MADHSPFTEKQKEELKVLVAEAMDAYFISKGRTWKGYVITLATVVGSLVVILGGMKALLAWLGFTYMKP